MKLTTLGSITTCIICVIIGFLFGLYWFINHWSPLKDLPKLPDITSQIPELPKVPTLPTIPSKEEPAAVGPPKPLGIGSEIKVIAEILNVREIAGGTILCIRAKDSVGKVVEGSVSKNGHVWWKVEFDRAWYKLRLDSPCTGWVSQLFIETK